MNLKEQHYIVTLADCGSMTRAANRLGVTQPALSSYLSSVENGLGYPLFERTGKRLVPTYLGEVYLEKARKILALGAEFDIQHDLVLHGHRGRLRVGFPIRRSPQLVPSVLKTFQNLYPYVELVIYEGNIKTMGELLSTDQLDLMLCNAVQPDQKFEYTLLDHDPVLFLAPRDHPLCGYAKYREGFACPWIDLKLFQQEVFILQHNDQSLRQYSDELLRQAGATPHRTTLIRNIETAAQMTASGLGVSFCLKSYLRDMRFIQTPQVFSVGERQLSADFSAAYPRGSRPSEHAVHLIELIRELVGMEENPLHKFFL